MHDYTNFCISINDSFKKGGNIFAVFSKMAVGLVYGLILGVVRMKTHNCYSTMLFHGVLNVFSM